MLYCIRDALFQHEEVGEYTLDKYKPREKEIEAGKYRMRKRRRTTEKMKNTRSAEKFRQAHTHTEREREKMLEDTTLIPALSIMSKMAQVSKSSKLLKQILTAEKPE